MEALTIGQVAKRAGVGVETIRFSSFGSTPTRRVPMSAGGRGPTTECPILEELDREEDDHANG